MKVTQTHVRQHRTFQNGRLASIGIEAEVGESHSDVMLRFLALQGSPGAIGTHDSVQIARHPVGDQDSGHHQ